uniref:Small ribosomal subunit protein bS20c n=1 Tax=Melanthalia intermedia TaxID=172989 RepID=A0A345UAR3_9FLOR|nr:ribosomal protein S20 [Melanthalia intermedia]AXI97549.1 ribosomal protein S20 [Melanthalia intermedia]
MPKNLSVVKKNQISLCKKSRNKSYKSVIKTLTKKYLSTINCFSSTNIDEALLRLSATYQMIDKAVSKGILHKNNGARKKSALARLLKNVSFENFTI